MGWEATAAQQGGVVDRTQLRGAGLTERQVDGRVVRGELAVVLPSVYRAASTPLTDAGRRWAGVLWSGGIASHATAGALWGLPVRRMRSSTSRFPTWTSGVARRRGCASTGCS